MSDIKVGGEVDALCTRCKMVLAHTVLAIWAGQIKRVRCNTCMGEHAYHKAGGSSASSTGPKVVRPRAPSSAKSAPAEEPAPSTYVELMNGKNRSDARPYGLKETFKVGDLVQHPTFGLGVVAAARGFDKIDVVFPATVKTLMHAKGSAPAVMAKPPAPRRPDVEMGEEGEPDAAPGEEAKSTITG